MHQDGGGQLIVKLIRFRTRRGTSARGLTLRIRERGPRPPSFGRSLFANEECCHSAPLATLPFWKASRALLYEARDLAQGL
jgi:hypothetical protein